MKKKISLVLGLLLAGVLVYALTFSNPYPDGEIVDGNITEFTIDGDVNMSVGWTIIDNGTATNPYLMNCAMTKCKLNITLTEYKDGITYKHYYFVDGFMSDWYNFTINRAPSNPTGMQAIGLNDTALNISWNKNPEDDISNYTLYGSNTTGVEINSSNKIVTVDNETDHYVEDGLVLGLTYYYKLIVTDFLEQNTVSSEFSGIVSDSIPPVEPIFDPVSGSTVNTTNPSITIAYVDTQNVTLKIYSGGTLVKEFPDSGLIFNWNPILAANTTYLFTMNANDLFSNERNTSYQITTNELAGVNVTILDTIHMTPSITPIITAIMPGEYWLFRYDISFYGGTNIRLTMTDFVGAGSTIDIPTDTQPFFFCEESYDAGNQDYNGTGQIDYLLNSVNESAPMLNCQDQNPSAVIDWVTYIKITVPSSGKSDSYGYTIYPHLY